MGKSKTRKDKRKRAKRKPPASGKKKHGAAHAIVVDEDGGTARHGIEFECPDCGLPVVLTHDDDDQPFALHDEPHCDAFVALERAEYVPWMRRAHNLEPHTHDSFTPTPVQIDDWSRAPDGALSGRCPDSDCPLPRCLDPHSSVHDLDEDRRIVILTYSNAQYEQRVRVNGHDVGAVAPSDQAIEEVFSRIKELHGTRGTDAFMDHLQRRQAVMRGAN
jgi:hypothetical protein